MTPTLCPRAACLRSLNLGTIRTVTIARPAAAPFSTTSPSTPSKQRPQPPKLQPFSILSSIPATQGIRHASTTPASPTNSTTSESVLTWDRFFDLRRKRRALNVVCSVGTAFTSVGVLAPVIAQQDLDSWGAQMTGIQDPMMMFGLMTFAVAGGGWLCGPSFGNVLFRMWASRKGWNSLIAEKEKSFYARINRYRADASASSPQNPIPDYYGEKIASVKDYRRWLKDQRAFNLKKNKNLI